MPLTTIVGYTMTMQYMTETTFQGCFSFFLEMY